MFYLKIFIAVLIFNMPPLWGQISFSSPDISEDSRLLFNVDFENVKSHSVLFLSDLDTATIRQLTAFPEHMDLLDNNRVLQVRNASGVLRIPVRGGLPQGGFDLLSGSLPPADTGHMAVSPNGRWMLRMARETHAWGSLVLEDVLSGESVLVSSRVEMPEKDFPASWSNDSGIFVYSKGGRLYYYSVNRNMPGSSSILDERFRVIGEGTINSINWDSKGDLYYLRSSSVYRLRTNELYTRTFYTDILERGTLAGRLPFGFNPHFDKFWIAPDADSLLLLKGGNEVFYYPLDSIEGNALISGLPYMVLNRNYININVLWSKSSGITLLASLRQNGDMVQQAWRLNPGNETFFVQLSPVQGDNASLSPDGSLVLFWGENGIHVFDYAEWRHLTVISSRPAYSCLWLDNNEVITGDSGRIERVVFVPGSNARIISRELICLSSTSNFGFETITSHNNAVISSNILAQCSGTWFFTDGRSAWTETANPDIKPASLFSDRYRVYIEHQSLGPFDNILMLRNYSSVGTFPIFPVIGLSLRSGPMDISLVFDLYDDNKGLVEVLEALERRNLKATFFLGGEFIRNFPAASRDIAGAGHEAASLFFSSIEFSDPRFLFDNDFIMRGLARNEDEFFNATGRELALFWHPPWYNISGAANDAAAAAGYETVDRDIDPLDWVSHEDIRSYGLPYYSAADMIDRIMDMIRPGMVIPVRLGLNTGGRTDYLFQRINVLLDALEREGYRIVPVSGLR